MAGARLALLLPGEWLFLLWCNFDLEGRGVRAGLCIVCYLVVAAERCLGRLL